MKRILLIQSREHPEMIQAESEGYRHVIGKLAQLDCLSAVDEKLSWSTPDEILAGYDAVIFGGSSDYDFHGGRVENDPARIMAMILLSRMRALVSYAFAEGLPVLGVCFGHQLIAEMHGGEVVSDPGQKKVGSHEVRLTEEGKRDALFRSLPSSFLAQYGHKDSVTNLPSGAILLASSPNCRFSALRYGPKVYTVQFHPEIHNPADFGKRLKHAGYLPEGIAPESVVRDSPDASKIIPLFVERIVTDA